MYVYLCICICGYHRCTMYDITCKDSLCIQYDTYVYACVYDIFVNKHLSSSKNGVKSSCFKGLWPIKVEFRRQTSLCLRTNRSLLASGLFEEVNR